MEMMVKMTVTWRHDPAELARVSVTKVKYHCLEMDKNIHRFFFLLMLKTFMHLFIYLPSTDISNTMIIICHSGGGNLFGIVG